MALQSMTGFARAAGEHGQMAIVWELRSVNGRSLDVRLRLPPGNERLEPAARQAVQARFARGNIQAALSVTSAAGSSRPVVNRELLAELAAQARVIEEEHGLAPARADGLLALRGVIEFPETSGADEEMALQDAAALRVLEEALAALQTARAGEGAALGKVLAQQIDAIEVLTRRAEADPSREPAMIRRRLAEQVALLLGASSQLDEDRLHTEAALLATKADIREEIDRLLTHVVSGRALLAEGGAVGRKLEFLAQEFNREANTLCSKSNASSVTAIGLELKAVVDQFREQVQNLQ